MDLKEVQKIIEKLEMFRYENVYTSEQIEKDKNSLKKLKQAIDYAHS
jgi:GH15 family glucan-1,4-alpha-glucosidase